MITKSDIKKLLNVLGFKTEDSKVYTKVYEQADAVLTVDVRNEHFGYAEAKIAVGRDTTSNFAEPENFVVFECVDRLLTKGYRPEHIELEPIWKLGHSSKSGYADIWVRTFKDNVLFGTDEDKDSLLIIECKKSDEFNGAWNDTLEDGAQLFSYFQQEKSTRFLCLYTADLTDEGKVTRDYYLLNVQDNVRMLENEEEALTYRAASNNKQLYKVWHETYHCDFAKIGLFEDSVQPYHIGKDKYTVNDLAPVNNETIKKKYSEFSNILRQHNVGAHENAFDTIDNFLLFDFSTPSVLWGIDGDWMVNYIAEDRPFHPTDHCGVIKVKDESVVLAKYLVYPLLKEGERERFSRANRASTERIKALSIKVPSIDIQRETVNKIFMLEQQIADLKSLMADCQNKKQAILDKYLK